MGAGGVGGAYYTNEQHTAAVLWQRQQGGKNGTKQREGRKIEKSKSGNRREREREVGEI